MLIGYARISKADGSQSLDLQRDALREAGVSDDAIYQDQASGQREDCPGLAAFLTTTVSRQISRTTRVYADGLHKLEPGQILELDVPVPPQLRNLISLYRTACEKLLCGKELHAQ